MPSLSRHQGFATPLRCRRLERGPLDKLGQARGERDRADLDRPSRGSERSESLGSGTSPSSRCRARALQSPDGRAGRTARLCAGADRAVQRPGAIIPGCLLPATGRSGAAVPVESWPVRSTRASIRCDARARVPSRRSHALLRFRLAHGPVDDPAISNNSRGRRTAADRMSERSPGDLASSRRCAPAPVLGRVVRRARSIRSRPYIASAACWLCGRHRKAMRSTECSPVLAKPSRWSNSSAAVSAHRRPVSLVNVQRPPSRS
jgi:hypothetical protein